MISETDASQTNSVCSSDDEIATFVSSLFEAQERDDEDDGGVFYFETDYAPLKANVDYMKLIRALAILDVQRMKVCSDIDKLVELKAKVREDPDAVKREILSGEAPFLTRCTIEKVPEIDWTKYKMLDFDGKLAPMTRRMAKQPPLHQGGGSSETRAQDQHQPRDGKIRVRGRVYTENKPQTFNQLWTVEEQMRLEALLVEFPPEPVESRRWKKIADALGNRTTKQVCSRVQKYFKKLQKAGIAIPGRIPQKSSSPNRINKRHKHLLYRPTTFFPGEAMRSICGSDDNSGGDEEGDGEEAAGAVGEEAATNQSASLNLNDGYLAHWVDILETIRKEKEATDMDSVRHYGFRVNLIYHIIVIRY
ncbi:hypothetical protein AAG570_002692 [Ranatra chinensis]|uniref:ZZ-type zinc finger-containing protein 3 n=1 Tax=Ranatra chinensis TaxID=642074 RepID=A0ABD0Y8D7_9HEMI